MTLVVEEEGVEEVDSGVDVVVGIAVVSEAADGEGDVVDITRIIDHKVQ